MDITIDHIPFEADYVDVVQTLAARLHTPEFHPRSPTPGKPINFHVELNMTVNSKKIHEGSGVLTLPTYSLGKFFLGAIRTAPINMGGRPLIFRQIYDNKPRKKVVELLLRVPYQDPTPMAEKQKRLESLDTAFLVKKISFGILTRDRKLFQEEWSKAFSGSCFLSFDQNEKTLRAKSADHSRTETQDIAVALPSIKEVIYGYDFGELFLLFVLHTPPSFEMEESRPIVQDYSGDGDLQYKGDDGESDNVRTYVRTRLTSLDSRHQRVAPFTSRVMRLHIVEHGDANMGEFLRLASVEKMRPPTRLDSISVERRDLYAKAKIHRLTEWMKRLDWAVAFQCEAFYRNAFLTPDELASLANDINMLCAKHGPEYTGNLLRYFAVLLRTHCVDVRERFEQAKTEWASQANSEPKKSRGYHDCRHAFITPTTMFLEGPLPDQSNRVLRLYPDHQQWFLRVNFTNEDRLGIRHDFEVDNPRFVREKFGGILHHGFELAGRHFDFLGYSSSALRDHAVWFVTPFKLADGELVDAESIRARLGDFSKVITCPARFGARLSQTFSATDPSVTLLPHELRRIDDIERNNSTFTDGVGTISRQLADEIWEKLCADRSDKRIRRSIITPSAYQIRLGGSKGMLAVDYRLEGRVACIRPSMEKFAAPDSLDIEISRAFDTPSPMYLNRPLIMLLEHLGVHADVFLTLQSKAVRKAREAIRSANGSAKLLKDHGLGASFRISDILFRLEKLGVDYQGLMKDTFLHRTLDFAVNHIFRDLKHHGRIPVPKSWTLVGIADEHDVLEEGQIYAFIRKKSPDDPGKLVEEYLQGRMLILRSPVVNPGDVQMVTAIGKPPPNSPFAQEQLPNCVVFSCRGSRSLPSCLGGGDLDGDLYNIIPLTEINPPKCAPPAEYPPAHQTQLNRPSTMADVADFVTDYINSDVLGLVSTNHLIIADQSKECMDDDRCMTLARLHSQAVDFTKSGTPVPVNEIPQPKFRARPDWSAGEMRDPKSAEYYESSRAIGKLFRDIDLQDMETLVYPKGDLKDRITPLLKNEVMKYLGDDISQGEVAFSNIRDSTFQLFNDYSTELKCIAATNSLSQSRVSVLKEEEIVAGTIVGKCAQKAKRTNLMIRMKTQTDELIKFVTGKLTEGETPHSWLKAAWAAWCVSADMIASPKPSQKQPSYGVKSFGLVALRVIFETIEIIEQAGGNPQ